MVASVLGAVVMASSRDLITIFVALELVTGPTFLMAGWRKGDARSNEAALKYFVIGVLSAAVLLFGMSLVYGVTGELTFTGIRNASVLVLDSDLRGLFIIGVLFTLLGFAFKVSAVPFHFWTPDTYEGAPTPVTAYLSVVSKTAGFVGLLAICYLAFGEVTTLWGAGLWILAALSMTVGNLIALRQSNVVRLLGYSSIAQGGFILVPFGAAIAANASGADLEEAFFATVTYLIIYAFMNLGAFAVVIAVGNRLHSAEIDDWGGLFTYSPALGGMMALFLFSLAGIPPLAGWFAKFVMFPFYYYSKVIISIFAKPVPDHVPVADLREYRTSPSLQFALVLTTIGVVAIGIYPPLVSVLSEATRTFASGF
jgi:NADH-quinone oxidoreductase subunit N